MSRKLFALGMLFLFLFVVIVGRVAYLSLVKGQQLQAMSEKQQTRHLDYYQYARGDFYDSLGRPLTGIEENCLVVFPAMLDDVEAAAAILQPLLDLEQDAIISRIYDNNSRTNSPYILKTGLSSVQTKAVTVADIKGIVALPLIARYSSEYPLNHLLGMLLPQGENGAYIGASGLEKEYDAYLSGRVDKQVVAYVDAGGELSVDDLYLLEEEDPVYNNVQLTINLDYQQIAARAFGSHSGACVILDPESGDILAAVSLPGYDPYGWEELAADDVYVNKAFSLYPPASTFKIILAAAALETGAEPLPEGAKTANQLAAAANTDTTDDGSSDTDAAAESYAASSATFYCDGAYTLAEGYDVACWNKEGHGEQTLTEAVANSCNCYFVALGLALGGEVIKEYAERFGMESDVIIGYELPLARHLDFSSYIDGDIANASIGEKGIRISPLQSAVMMSACVNGGYLVVPRLVQDIYDQDNQAIETFPLAEKKSIISAALADTLKQMLIETVNSGTAAKAQGAYVDAGGKTGTTQDFGVWFSGFAPAEQPLYVIAIYVADGSSGGTEAASIFKKIIDDLALLEGI